MQNLLGIDLNTVVPGGTNSDGSTVNIGYQLLTSTFPIISTFHPWTCFVVPGSILPMPEPSAFLLSITGG